MANEEHLKLLKEAIEKKDIEIWNEWRKENLNVTPDRNRADLSGAMLIGADLFGANLSAADLRGANLSGANLSGANLSYASLYGVDLSGADLFGANLQDAKGLYASQIMSAKRWGATFYSQEILKGLGLPPDLIERLKKELEEEHAEK